MKICKSDQNILGVLRIADLLTRIVIISKLFIYSIFLHWKEIFLILDSYVFSDAQWHKGMRFARDVWTGIRLIFGHKWLEETVSYLRRHRDTRI